MTKAEIFLKNLIKSSLPTLEGLFGHQAQIKDDLTVLPENIVLESSKFKYVPIRV